jgi:hypothetical protein
VHAPVFSITQYLVIKMTRQEINEEIERQRDLLRQNLIDLMVEKNLVAADLAKITGHSKRKINNWFAGATNCADVMMSIVVALGAEISLVTEVEE